VIMLIGFEFGSMVTIQMEHVIDFSGGYVLNSNLSQ